MRELASQLKMSIRQQTFDTALVPLQPSASEEMRRICLQVVCCVFLLLLAMTTARQPLTLWLCHCSSSGADQP